MDIQLENSLKIMIICPPNLKKTVTNKGYALPKTMITVHRILL